MFIALPDVSDVLRLLNTVSPSKIFTNLSVETCFSASPE